MPNRHNVDIGYPTIPGLNSPLNFELKPLSYNTLVGYKLELLPLIQALSFLLFVFQLFPSQSTFLPAYLSSLPLSALLPSLTLCHIALSHSLLSPLTYHCGHTLPLPVSSIFLYLPSSLSLPSLFNIFLLHSCFRPH